MDKIERVEDQNRLIIRNSIIYLHNLIEAKKLNNRALISLYRTKCRLMELRRRIYLPQQKSYQRCPQCFLDFPEGPTQFEVRPAKLSGFAKKLVAKVKNNGTLTDYQKTYYKKLLKKYPNGFQCQNKMVLTCSFCKKETQIPMHKPKRKKPNNVVKPAPSKKKTKKKDKLCGLNEDAVNLLSSKKQNAKRGFEKSNNTMSSDITNVKATSEKSNINASISMTNTRVFETSDFISLNPNEKQKPTLRFSKRKAEAKKTTSPKLSKLQKKQQKKNLNSLSNILKRASSDKARPGSKLKNFLASL